MYDAVSQKRFTTPRTDKSEEGFGAGLLQIREGMACQRETTSYNSLLRLIVFPCKRLSSAETLYSNIQRKALGIPHGSQKFYHYSFAKEVMIPRKDRTTLSQRLQCILLKIHEYKINIV